MLKFLIGIVCGAVANRVVHLHAMEQRHTGRGKYLAAVTVSAFSGLFVNVFADPFLGYFRNRYLFGQTVELASAMAGIASGVTLVNSLLSTVCAVALYLVLQPALKRAHLLPGTRAAN